MQHYDEILIRMSLALLAGGLIGLERAQHGRPAGLRTHTLVCAASCLLMLFAAFQWDVVSGKQWDTVRVDPTRMAQGIMTGIGFLGAGVIMRERFTVRGLTTAGSIWITAAIGIVIGMGFYSIALVSTIGTFVVLSGFRYLERVIPTLHFGKLQVKTRSTEILEKERLYELIEQCHVFAYEPSYSLEDDGRMFVYEMTIRSYKQAHFQELTERLCDLESVREFSVIPTGD